MLWNEKLKFTFCRRFTFYGFVNMAKKTLYYSGGSSKSFFKLFVMVTGTGPELA
jgi:hypothetical protein